MITYYNYITNNVELYSRKLNIESTLEIWEMGK
jgi:hypothetical protein